VKIEPLKLMIYKDLVTGSDIEFSTCRTDDIGVHWFGQNRTDDIGPNLWLHSEKTIPDFDEQTFEPSVISEKLALGH
jgi:hypothetical protein